MASSLEIDHKKMYDIRSAAAATGYSRDHVTALARSNKIVAALVGRQWYIDLDSLKQYAHITELEQKVKQKHLGEERKTTREIAANLEAQKEIRENRQQQQIRRVRFSVLSLAFLLVILGGSLSYFAPDTLAPVSDQLASASKSGLPTTAVFDGKSLIPVTPNTATTFSDGTVSVVTLASPQQAIVLLPNGLATSSAVFSDEVEIILTESGEQRIVIEGEASSEGIPFVTVDVNEIVIP